MTVPFMEAVGRAIRARDQGELGRMTEFDPVATLVYLDGYMRGLIRPLDGDDERDWLIDIDRVLRQSLDRMGSGDMERRVDLRILRAGYEQGSLFLVTGAGTSIPAKLPGWKDLVIRFLQLVLNFGSPAQRARVEANIRNGPLQFAWAEVDDHVREALADLVPLPDKTRNVAELTLKELQSKVSYTNDDLMRATAVAKECFGDKFFDHLKGILYFSGSLETTETHHAIARMVRPNPVPHRPSPRIFSILTYNFDDLLERAIRSAGHKVHAVCSRQGEWCYQFGPRNDTRPAAIDVWHVHGYAPFDMRSPSGLDLVFTAEEFERSYGAGNSITRVVQEAHFGEALGLILGSSLTDEYAVAQLTQAHRKKPGWYHYVVLKRPGTRSSSEYKSMGLRVFWVDDFDREIPWLLDAITDFATSEARCGRDQRELQQLP